ncbi:PP0621 family protein [Rhodoferax sp.]|uniref:PP0621 family protein n=1 Tax=Rhodoferax sp. TaxID=50421 RepID=UPI00374CF9B1
MKFVWVLLVVLAGVWLWRSSRQSDPRLHRENEAVEPPPLDMVRCTLCSVHFPSGDGVQGNKGWYCSADHRQRAEP